MPHIVTIFAAGCGLLGGFLIAHHALVGHVDHADLYVGGGLLIFAAYLFQNGPVKELVDKVVDKLPLPKGT